MNEDDAILNTNTKIHIVEVGTQTPAPIFPNSLEHPYIHLEYICIWDELSQLHKMQTIKGNKSILLSAPNLNPSGHGWLNPTNHPIRHAKSQPALLPT
jgi:hypothetical protein